MRVECVLLRIPCTLPVEMDVALPRMPGTLKVVWTMSMMDQDISFYFSF
jgi:hypothetical protein